MSNPLHSNKSLRFHCLAKQWNWFVPENHAHIKSIQTIGCVYSGPYLCCVPFLIIPIYSKNPNGLGKRLSFRNTYLTIQQIHVHTPINKIRNNFKTFKYTLRSRHHFILQWLNFRFEIFIWFYFFWYMSSLPSKAKKKNKKIERNTIQWYLLLNQLWKCFKRWWLPV